MSTWVFEATLLLIMSTDPTLYSSEALASEPSDVCHLVEATLAEVKG